MLQSLSRVSIVSPAKSVPLVAFGVESMRIESPAKSLPRTHFSIRHRLWMTTACRNKPKLIIFSPTPTPIPEPSSVLGLLSLGVLGIGSALKRQS